MLDALLVWSLVELIGLVTLPASALLFARLPGSGLAFARPLGLLVAAYPIWLLASVHALPYGRATVAGGIAFACLLGLGAWLTAGRPRPSRRDLRLLVAAEAVFTATFAGWSLLRSFSPAILETEKPMDMAFVNAVNRSEWFPPHDPWLSGESLNYYYYGHYLVAFLVRATGVDSETGYNLGVALFFALTASAVFAFASTFVLARRKDAAGLRPLLLPGLVAVAIAMLLGNLAGSVELLRNPTPLVHYDWWTPSRVIDGTANEFPFFSFLLGDLHAHLMATPFALVALAITMQLALTGRGGGGSAGRSGRLATAAVVALSGLVFGSLYATSTLDFPTAAVLLVGGAVLWVSRAGGSTTAWRDLAWCAAVLLVGLGLFTPFVANYAPATDGIALVREHEPFVRFVGDLTLIYALPLVVIAGAVAARLRVPFRYLAWSGVALLVVLVLLAPDRIAGLFLALALTAFAVHAALDRRLEQPDRFFWLLVAVGVGLLAVTDFAYIRDSFDATASYRFNTVFKAGYQAWFLLAVAATYAIFRQSDWFGRRVRLGWQAALVAGAVLLAAYPVAASYARSGGFDERPTLDGLRWLERRAPDDVRAIRWLREHVRGDPTILEATGADFSPAGHARVSTFTGLPTVLGWAGHEVQWGHDPRARATGVATIYRTRDLRLALRLLRGYGVRYIFVGQLERAQYGRRGLAKFHRLGRPVFRSGSTVVYRVR